VLSKSSAASFRVSLAAFKSQAYCMYSKRGDVQRACPIVMLAAAAAAAAGAGAGAGAGALHCSFGLSNKDALGVPASI